IGNGEKAIVVTNGVIINVKSAASGAGLLDLEADRLVIFTHGGDDQDVLNPRPGADPSGQRREVEFYLSGNVELREQSGKASRTLRADEVYYDVQRGVAVALSATLEVRQPTLVDPIFVKADEMLRTSATTFEVTRAEIFSSKLPSDPGLKVYVAQATIEDRK